LDMNTGIYQIVCKTTGKRYIGSAASRRGFEYRWRTHRNSLSSGKHSSPHLQSAWNKYGADDFYFSVIEYAPAEHCLSVEQEWLDMVPADRLLNCKPTANGGGMHGKRHSEETRAKMSELAKGRVISDETRAKISAAKKGIVTREYRRKNGTH